MNDAFAADYVAVYDALYEAKDYAGECEIVERAFRAYGDGPINDVLDLGCGTGGHAVPLARRGYIVHGIDLSAPMIAAAEARKARASDVADRLSFARGDARTVDAGRTFDAVIMMFAVLGYQTANEDVVATLANVRRHLEPGGLFVFDAWYGPAVLTAAPAVREITVPCDGGRVVRTGVGALDPRHHLSTVTFRVRRLAGEREVAAFDGTHRVRYFFPLEIEYFLAQAGLRLCHLSAFPTWDGALTNDTWNFFAVAQATEPQGSP
jgi:SAM-dependent methyltransferase